MAEATGTIDAAKAAQLAAGAQAGDAGVAAYQAAQANIAAQQKAALASIASNAGLINAGADATAALQGIARTGQDRIFADVGLGQAAFQRDLQASERRHQNYLSEARAAVPLVVELGRQKGEESANDVLEKARKKAEEDALSDSELRTRLIGQAQIDQQQALAPLQDQLAVTDAAIRKASKRAKSGAKALKMAAKIDYPDNYKGARLNRKAVKKAARSAEDNLERLVKQRSRIQAKAARQASVPLSERARQIGTEAGYDPERVFGLVGAPQDAQYASAAQRFSQSGVSQPDKAIARGANVSIDRLPRIRGSKVYTEAKKAVMDALSAGMSWEEVDEQLRGLLLTGQGSGRGLHKGTRYPKTYRVLKSELRSLFPSLSDLSALQFAGATGGT